MNISLVYFNFDLLYYKIWTSSTIFKINVIKHFDDIAVTSLFFFPDQSLAIMFVRDIWLKGVILLK